MGMKIPKSVNVLGHPYRIKMVDHLGLVVGQTGECDYNLREIRLLKGLNKESTFQVLLHEIRHAYQFESGFTQILDHQAMELDADGFVSLVTSLFDLRWKRLRP